MIRDNSVCTCGDLSTEHVLRNGRRECTVCTCNDFDWDIEASDRAEGAEFTRTIAEMHTRREAARYSPLTGTPYPLCECGKTVYAEMKCYRCFQRGVDHGAI